MKIIRASVSNFERISVVEITPSGDIIEISGNNKQGKSSCLNAIESALRGKNHHPKKVIHRGEEKARVVIETETLTVERVWTEKSDRLVVRGKDGAEYPRAQERLNGLVGGLAFNPLAFDAMPPAEQRAVLLSVVGVDLDEYDERYQKIYDDRREIGRTVRTLEGAIAELPGPDPDLPDKESSASDLAEELEAALKTREANAEARRRYREAVEHEVECADRVAELEEELAEAQTELTAASKATKAAKTAARALPDDPPINKLQSRMKALEATNAKVREAAKRKSLELSRKKAQSQYDAKTKRLQAIEKEKRDALDSAEFPIEGLSVSDDEVLFDGIPLEQASGAEKIQICTAISAALQPELRIALIRNGNDFDRETLKEFYKACKKAGVQAWVERVEPTLGSAVVIEDGRVAGEVEEAADD